MNFKIKDGRGGLIEFEYSGRQSMLDWKMLSGDSAMVIFYSGCKPVNQPGEIMGMAKIIEVVQAIYNREKLQM